MTIELCKLNIYNNINGIAEYSYFARSYKFDAYSSSKSVSVWLRKTVLDFIRYTDIKQ